MSSKEFVWPVRVYYEDTDAGGVVYYANYLKFMERARSEWLRHLGFEQDRLAREDCIVFAVRQVSVDYLKPARFNELLRVSVRIEERGQASLRFLQSVFNEAGEALCTGRVRIACLDTVSFRPRPIPDAIRAELEHVC